MGVGKQTANWALALGFGLAVAGASIGCGGTFSDDRSTIEVVSGKVGGKNVFIPSTIVVTAGKGQRLSVYNGTDMPHGFAIAGADIQEILQPGQEYEIELPELVGGAVYRVHCHLHPPHRSATLVVLPGK